MIAAPLLTNLISILVNIYLKGLISGFEITLTAVVYCLSQLFLTFFLIYFLVMLELILVKRIELCETSHIEKTVFLLKKLMGVYNIGVFVLGAYTFYGALVVAEFLPFLASIISQGGSIFLSPSIFYDNVYFLGEKSLHFVANLLTIF